MGTTIPFGDALDITAERETFPMTEETETLHFPTYSGMHDTLCGVYGFRAPDETVQVKCENPKGIQLRMCRNCYNCWRGEIPDGKDV